MSFLWVSVLAVMVLIAVTARIDLRLRAAFASNRDRQDRRHATNIEAARSVQERLLVGPLPVVATVETGWRGKRLVLRLDDLVLRLHLYGGADRLRARGHAGPAPAAGERLARLTDTTDRGWQVVIDGPHGTSTFEGWLLERRDQPAAGRARRERSVAG